MRCLVSTQFCPVLPSSSVEPETCSCPYFFLQIFSRCSLVHHLSQTFWHRLPIFQVDLHCVLHHVATLSCRGHVDELATEPFLLLHCKHGTGYRWSWNCCDRRTRFVVIWKHFCFILSTGTKIQIDSVMRPRSSSSERNTSASVTVIVTVTVTISFVALQCSFDITVAVLLKLHMSKPLL